MYDAKYVGSKPEVRGEEIRNLLKQKKHVLCVSPISIKEEECRELYSLAEENNCILFDGIKVAYSTAFLRMLLLVKSGKIGTVVSIDATCTSMADFVQSDEIEGKWNSICAWGPTALLPIFQLLGTQYVNKNIVTKYADKDKRFDSFTKIDFIYQTAVASIKVAKKVKSEGELIISGTKGYIYVPSPWWKMDYFEIRYENPQDNKRYFYQLDGEGMRNEIAAFAKSCSTLRSVANVSKEISIAISKIIEDFYNGNIEEIN